MKEYKELFSEENYIACGKIAMIKRHIENLFKYRIWTQWEVIEKD